ncbi:hypothetical protein [Agrobacterium pusense]|uniref:hypothetical protein n=1 Tax=Agrobacterium pusense TaxID=648995 RepID=UPI000EE83667|nr:hypothetical protein [Agrobacterium sp.]
MGRMTVIPGTSAITLSGAPKITMTDWERQIAALPGLRHVIDPAKLDSVGNGRDRFNGALITSKNPGVTTKAEANAQFNNLPTITFADKTGGLLLPKGTVTKSVSFIAAALLSPENSGSCNLLTSFIETAYQFSFRVNDLQTLRFYSDNSDTVSNTIVSPNFPAPGTAGIWAFSFDADTMQSANLFKNSSGQAQLLIRSHTVAPTATELSRWAFGGSAGTLGWLGSMGMGLIFDRALHMPTLEPFFWKAIQLMKTKYGIA